MLEPRGWNEGVQVTAQAGAVLQRLGERMDALSTRLLLHGVGAVRGGDFTALADAAAADGVESVAAVAQRLARQVAAATEAEGQPKQREALVSRGLEELRSLLEARPFLPLLEAPAANGVSGPQPVGATLEAFAADPEMIAEFVAEAREHLAAIVDGVLELEKDSVSGEGIHAVFRAFHTIKGLAGFLEFSQIQEVAHEVETLLDLARTGRLAITPPVVDVVLESTDSLRQEIAGIEQRLNGGAGEATGAGNAALLARIRAASGVGAGPQGTGSCEARYAAPGADAARASQTRHATEALETAAVETTEFKTTAGTPTRERREVAETRAVVSEVAAEPHAALLAEVSAEGAAAVPVREERRASDVTSVRIETAKLDHLMNMVGEMVIAQTLISHNPNLAVVRDARLLGDLTQLTRITAEVQKITTSMRMVPIGQQFQRMARLIRDLARKAEKQIVLGTSGEETELDKTIAEQLSDPLLHMVRNAIDHGIETPEERMRAGKDATARIRLAAYHRSGQIVLEVADDGRGLDRDRILKKAMERNLVKPGAQLTDNEVFLLIFEPGFSTAERITDLSGRGVGMDVVRRQVQRLRGRIEIQTEPGRGTTFLLQLPLTLAIIEGLVVRTGESLYILPLFAVTEIFRPEPSVLSTVQGRGEMALVRGHLLPVVRLHERFGLVPRVRALCEGMLVVVESQGRQFCLFVDELVGKQEVVIKSLGEMFREVAGLAGCAILGDGRVGLILDIEGIVQGRP